MESFFNIDSAKNRRLRSFVDSKLNLGHYDKRVVEFFSFC